MANDIDERPNFGDPEDDKFSFEAQERTAPAVKDNEGAETPAPAPAADTTKTDQTPVQGADNQATPPAPEQKTDDTATLPVAEQGQDGDGEAGDQTDRKDSRANKRIRQLLQERDEARAAAAGQPAATVTTAPAPTAPAGNQPATPPQVQLPSYQPGQEVTPEQIQRDVVQAADLIAQARVDAALAKRDAQAQGQERINNFNTDLAYAEQFGALNPDSAEFDPDISEAVTSTYHDLYTANPDTRLKDVVDRFKTVIDKASEKAASQTNATTAQQAANAALTPTQGTTRAKTIDEMSDEELEAKLGFVN